MSNNNVCIGGYDIIHNRKVRLLNESAQAFKSNSPFQVGEIYNTTYRARYTVTPPHLEDIAVYRYERSTFDQNTLNNVTNFMCKSVNNFNEIFNGMLINNNGKWYLPLGSNLDFSTEIIRLPFDLTKVNDRFELANIISPISIKYVGDMDIIYMPNTIQAGTKIRFSLARWWQVNENTEPRAYLQLSGIY